MNLFSRLDELLDGNDELTHLGSRGKRNEATRLVRSMEMKFEIAKGCAAKLIAAERSVYYELNRQLQREPAHRMLISWLQEECARARAIKSAVKRSLRELREGLEHARCVRDTISRWSAVGEGAGLNRHCRLFWLAYHRLCDLADEQMDKSTTTAKVPCYSKAPAEVP